MRSGREHCGSRVAVGRGGRGGRRGGGRRGGGGGEEEDEKREEKEEDEDEEEATDIKSNNPHLAGGEKKVQTHGQGLGRGLAGDMGLNPLGFLFFFVFHGFLQFGQNLEKNKKNQKKKFRPMGKVWGEAWLGTWV